MSTLRTYARLVCSIMLILSLGLLYGCALPGLSKPKPAPPAPVKGTTVALVVPRGEVVKAVKALIAGAQQGCASQAGTKQPARVRVIYTDGTWLQDLAALPERTVVGVLSEASYRQMLAAGLMDKKVVFAFRTKLPAGDEGTHAWRFFPSMEDQVRTAVNFCVDGLGVSNVASFGPGDAYSTAYMNLLEQELAGRNIVLQRIAASGDPSNWGAVLKPHVNPQVHESNGTLMPQTPFGAVFLTDSWRRLASVNTAFGSNGEERLFMLGTMLWDDVNLRGNQNARQYAMVAWPSAYLRSRAPASLANTSFGNFWGALGYDFARFAARLGISGRPSAAEVTSACRKTTSMSFAMAPIVYNAQGLASQRLFMVQAGLAGTKPADIGEMKSARDAAYERVEERGLGQAASLPSFADETPSSSALVPAAAAMPADRTPPSAVTPQRSSLPAQQPSGPIMRSAPNPSYKLSLPGVQR